ncbi:MAG: gamma-glutamylcyclotransferase family protein [Myxococcota bacterium]
MSQPLFVYDAGGPTAGLLGKLPRRQATARGTLYALPAGYPALVLLGDDRVHGELVDGVDHRLLGLLDAYGGVHEGLYSRVTIDVHYGLRSAAAWAYVLDAARARAGRRLPGGRWVSPVRR